MKNLDLNGLGVQELNATEMREVEGGGVVLAFLAGVIVSGLVGELIFEGPKSCWDSFQKGLNTAY